MIRHYVLHPEIGNDQRREVREWCKTSLKDYYWFMNSNYKRSLSGTFDITVTDLHAAELFILRWGGQIVDVQDITEDGMKSNFYHMFEADL
jgi:hypothetical protein